jgi:hypothetical protein
MPTQSFFFSSDTAAYAQNVSSDGTRFEVQMPAPIAVPRGAVDCELAVTAASIWNTSPNIGPGLGPAGADNNNFRYTTSVAPAGTYAIVMPAGLYALAAISAYLKSQFTNNGHPVNLFSIGGQAATGQGAVTILTLGDTVHFEQAGSVGSILGFASAAIVSAVANYTAYGTSVATLNRNNTYLIMSDLITGGIPRNGNASGILAAIPIEVEPYRQINYEAVQVLWTPATELVGQGKTNFSFRLTNERGEATPTAGDTWSFSLVVRYTK